MRFGIRLPPCGPVGEVADAAQLAESLGFESAWVPDSQLLWRDGFGTLIACAMRTERLLLGSAVTNVSTRHPSVVASAARTIEEVAPGRFVLGVGVGDSSVSPIGMPKAKTRELEERLAAIRALLRGEAWDFGGGPAVLQDVERACPIHIAATGPKNLALAGRCADGVILLGGVATSLIQRSLDLVAEGAHSVGRDPSEIEVTVATFACVTDDVASAAQVLKPVVLTIATGGGKGALAAVGVEVQPGFVPGSHGDDVYPDLLHAVDAQAAIDFAGQYVSDEAATRFAETFCLFGDTDSIRQRVDAVAATGVNRIYVQDTQSYGLPLPLMEQFRPVIEQERP